MQEVISTMAQDMLQGTDRALVMLARRREELLKQINNASAELRRIDAALSQPDVQNRIDWLQDNELLDNVLGIKISEDLSSEPVWRLAVYVLTEAGSPLELDELAERIQAKGKEFGGEDPKGSLAAHISKHPEHLRQKRGKAYLAEWL